MLEKLLDDFVAGSREILKENLVGVYLHGSAAMGCFHEKKSDVDLLIVVKEALTGKEKRRYMDMVVHLNGQAPPKGIEMSIVREEVCRPFVYPTPFELHFSITHLNWYQTDPEGYVENMKGTDKDLAAHVTILRNRGKTLYGKEISAVFGEVPREVYLDSIWYDVQHGEEDILENPMYVILNLCRVLAYRKDHLILSKQEGGAWGLKQIWAFKYKELIAAALLEYETGEDMVLQEPLAVEFAKEMLKKIRSDEGCTCWKI